MVFQEYQNYQYYCLILLSIENVHYRNVITIEYRRWSISHLQYYWKLKKIPIPNFNVTKNYFQYFSPPYLPLPSDCQNFLRPFTTKRDSSKNADLVYVWFPIRTKYSNHTNQKYSRLRYPLQKFSSLSSNHNTCNKGRLKVILMLQVSSYDFEPTCLYVLWLEE